MQEMKRRFGQAVLVLATALALVAVLSGIAELVVPRTANALPSDMPGSPTRGQVFIPYLMNPVLSVGKKPTVITSGSTVLSISGGFLMYKAVGNAAIHLSWTSSVVQPPYPTQLRVALVTTASAAKACTSATIWGTTYNGMGVKETLNTLGRMTDATLTTVYSYATIDRVDVAGCSNGGAVTDFALAMGPKVAPPRRLRAITDLLGACVFSGTVVANASGPSQINDPHCATKAELAAMTYNGLANTIDLSALTIGGQTPTFGTAVYLNYRGIGN